MASPGTDPTLSGWRVLVVEDEYFIADDLSFALQQLGAHVVGPVQNQENALNLLRTEAVDAAILDINLRGKPVFPVAEALLSRGIPFVFATGYDATSLPPAFQHVPRWEKPFNPRDLARMLSAVLRH